ncbi:hypothetical protein HBB16_15205, partial [Pseudonocardia sp. MCCB 268]|nr:hypothetical protein [Pseudonocardia cytotoxica]
MIVSWLRTSSAAIDWFDAPHHQRQHLASRVRPCWAPGCSGRRRPAATPAARPPRVGGAVDSVCSRLFNPVRTEPKQ